MKDYWIQVLVGELGQIGEIRKFRSRSSTEPEQSETGGEVTPASVVTATGQMSDAQKAQTRTNLGAVSTSTMGAVYTWLEELEALVTATETISGTTPTIAPEANTIYQCGELSSLTIESPPALGVWSVVFASGTMATQTTIPASILGLEDFAADVNMLYEINVLDNRAVWRGWPLPEVTV